MIATTPRHILVTTGLLYANGPIHLGHMLEEIQADIWVRWQRLCGRDCIFISGDDAHGTPIMLSAKQQQISPEELIANIKQEHEKDFVDFDISFDNYYTTHSPENRELVSTIYQQLKQNDDIETREVIQAFDATANIFLPDRFVRGICPRCGAENQPGDNCDVCGATYEPSDLKNAISVISGTKPTSKSSLHYFFRLEKYATMLHAFIKSGSVPTVIANKLEEWFAQGLKPWDISRDEPYFGFPIPDAPHKYFYVWLDAPIGYMASFQNLCAQRPALNFMNYWGKDSKADLYHFIGKDIVYFHSLFWPAILESSGWRKPTAMFVHGYLTINGQKMSKSKNTFITARAYLDAGLNPEYLRYYFATKLHSGIDDIDLSLTDFVARVNSDLVGKVVNIASRCAKFILNLLAANLDDEKLWEYGVGISQEIAAAYEKLEYGTVTRLIMSLADKTNQYIDEQKPWKLAKEAGNAEKVLAVCSMGLNIFRLLIIYLKPIVPHLAKDAEVFLNIAPLTWDDHAKPLLHHTINKFQPLLQRVAQETVNTLIK